MPGVFQDANALVGNIKITHKRTKDIRAVAEQAIQQNSHDQNANHHQLAPDACEPNRAGEALIHNGAANPRKIIKNQKDGEPVQ